MSSQMRSVWFATQDRIQSKRKGIVFDDTGTLQVTTDNLSFVGRKYNIHVSHIHNVSLVQQRIPWVTYIVVNILALVPMAVYTAQVPTLSVMYILSLVLLNLAGILIGRSTKWALVVYKDGDQISRCAYFADGSLFGWRGIFGGTKELYQVLKAIQEQPSQ